MEKEKEAALIARAQEGNITARNTIIEANLYLVRFTASQYARTYRALFDDLVQEGTLGLFRALEDFDLDRGTRFSTYAKLWIRTYINEYIDRSNRYVFFEEGDDTHVPDDTPSSLAKLVQFELLARLRKVIPWIASGVRERDILYQRFERLIPTTYSEIGAIWRVSRQRVQQFEAQLLAKFRDAILTRAV